MEARGDALVCAHEDLCIDRNGATRVRALAWTSLRGEQYLVCVAEGQQAGRGRGVAEWGRRGPSGRADVSLVGLWGYGPGQHKARFYCVPERAEQFRNFTRSAGFDVTEGTTFYLTGADRPGALVEWLDKIAAAGINLQAIEAVGIHGEFGCFIWANPDDHERLKKMLT